jgi:hypothetical protein
MPLPPTFRHSSDHPFSWFADVIILTAATTHGTCCCCIMPLPLPLTFSQGIVLFAATAIVHAAVRRQSLSTATTATKGHCTASSVAAGLGQVCSKRITGALCCCLRRDGEGPEGSCTAGADVIRSCR